MLKWNIFEFGLKLFLKLIGTAKGTILAPTYAIIFMKKNDDLLHQKAETFRTKLIHFYKRFIDDIFIIWIGTEEQLIKFVEDINKAHPTIKFTVAYDLKTRSTTILDTTVTITAEGKIKSKLQIIHFI